MKTAARVIDDAVAGWLTRAQPHPDAPGLDALVADPDRFIHEVLFRRVEASSNAGSPRAGFVTSDELWEGAVGRGARTPFFRLVRDGATLPSSRVTRTAGAGHRTIDDVIQPNRALEEHAAGATMVFQGLQLTDPHLAKVANNLALDLGHAVQINAYVSPVAARGLELHFDYHDVFVVQLDGRKRWRVWAPLDGTRQPVRVGPRTPMPTFAELAEPLVDTTLEAGDCLYLPRGFPHAAETVESASGHLTIGIMAMTWHQAVRHAADDAVAGPSVLRASVPAGVTDGPGLADLAAHLQPGALRRWMVRDTWKRQPATRLRPLHPPDIGPDTPVVVTPGPLLWSRVNDGRAELGLGDRTLSLPTDAAPMLDAVLRSEGCFTLAALDTPLDVASAVVVGRRLTAEGVLARG